MNMNNYGIAEGRLTRDPVILTNRDGSRKVKFTVAAQDNFKGSDGKHESQFINFDAFVRADKENNGVYDIMHKGDLVKVHYTVKTNNYKDKDGSNVFSQLLFAQEIQLCESKSVVGARRARNAADSEDTSEEDDLPF